MLFRSQKAGTIVNISSGCAIHAWPGWGPYSAAKAGLNQFGHCLYTELRAAGVRVATITPYWGATGFVGAARISTGCEIAMLLTRRELPPVYRSPITGTWAALDPTATERMRP